MEHTANMEDFLRSIAEQLEMAGRDETITGFNGMRIPVSDIAKCARMALGAPTPLGSAAPELLAACKDALTCLEKFRPPTSGIPISNLKAAIAKAEGVSNGK